MNTATNTILGAICYYRGITQFVVETIGDSKLKVLNPSNNVKLVVRLDNPNLTITANRLQVVTYKDSQYLVSPAGLIISLTTGKIMQWVKTDGNRIAIMALLKSQTVKTDAAPVKPVKPVKPQQPVENDLALDDDIPF